MDQSVALRYSKFISRLPISGCTRHCFFLISLSAPTFGNSLHGGHAQPEDDGHPESWYTMDDVDVGYRFNASGQIFENGEWVTVFDGTNNYTNDQAACSLVSQTYLR